MQIWWGSIGQTAEVQFTLSLAMCPPEDVITFAARAEASGWDAVTFPDSVFHPEQVTARYPFTPDVQGFWAPDSPLIDPFVAIRAVATATERIRLGTSVLKAPLREPLFVAKAITSIASMFPDRLEVGVGLSWIPEEFDWLGQD